MDTDKNDQNDFASFLPYFAGYLVDWLCVSTLTLRVQNNWFCKNSNIWSQSRIVNSIAEAMHQYFFSFYFDSVFFFFCFLLIPQPISSLLLVVHFCEEKLLVFFLLFCSNSSCFWLTIHRQCFCLAFSELSLTKQHHHFGSIKNAESLALFHIYGLLYTENIPWLYNSCFNDAPDVLDEMLFMEFSSKRWTIQEQEKKPFVNYKLMMGVFFFLVW